MNKLKEILKEQGRSQKWLSEQLAVSRQTVVSWSNNKTQPSTRMSIKICEILDIDLNKFVDWN